MKIVVKGILGKWLRSRQEEDEQAETALNLTEEMRLMMLLTGEKV